MNFSVNTTICFSVYKIMNLSPSFSSRGYCFFAITLPRKCYLLASYNLQFTRQCISSSTALDKGRSRSHMLVLSFVYLPRSTSNRAGPDQVGPFYPNYVTSLSRG